MWRPQKYTVIYRGASESLQRILSQCDYTKYNFKKIELKGIINESKGNRSDVIY
jgi:hypothetical protein